MLERLNPANYQVEWDRVLDASVTIVLAIAVSYLVYRIAFAIVERLVKLSEAQVDEMIVERVRRPVKWAIIAVGITFITTA